MDAANRLIVALEKDRKSTLASDEGGKEQIFCNAIARAVRLLPVPGPATMRSDSPALDRSIKRRCSSLGKSSWFIGGTTCSTLAERPALLLGRLGLLRTLEAGSHQDRRSTTREIVPSPCCGSGIRRIFASENLLTLKRHRPHSAGARASGEHSSGTHA